jgi:hypothetical protein
MNCCTQTGEVWYDDLVDIPTSFIWIVIFFGEVFDMSMGFLNSSSGCKTCTSQHSTMCFGRSVKDDQLVIRPHLRKTSNTNMVGGWKSKFKFNFGDNQCNFSKENRSRNSQSDPKFGRRGGGVLISMPGKKVLERRSNLRPSEKTFGMAFLRVPSQKYPWRQLMDRYTRSTDFTGWDYVSELLPLTNILFIPQMIWIGERRWSDINWGKPKDWEKNLSQCQSVHHKSHVDWSGREPGPPRWGTGD